MNLTLQTLDSINCVNSAEWDRLDHGQSPFLEHGFLRALEESASVGEQAGWIPKYLSVFATDKNSPNPTLVGAIAAFIKFHSYGEYIFDWSWANASERAGIPYYPKILIAAPFTPATGKRLLLDPKLDPQHRSQIIKLLINAVFELSHQIHASSIHWLFVDQQDYNTIAEFGFFPRSSFQFHWHNQNYNSFSDYLNAMTSRRRKQIRKERRCAQQSIEDITFGPGQNVSVHEIDLLTQFYRSTTKKHGAHAYLRPQFFPFLFRYLGHRIQFARATTEGQTIAGALFFEGESTLYGRYWGAQQELPFLHFELSYYAAIERCIERGIQHFEAGAQGEHKLLRGFIPTQTHSVHWIRHPKLRDAVISAVQVEALRIEQQMQALSEYDPFRHSDH